MLVSGEEVVIKGYEASKTDDTLCSFFVIYCCLQQLYMYL